MGEKEEPGRLKRAYYTVSGSVQNNYWQIIAFFVIMFALLLGWDSIWNKLSMAGPILREYPVLKQIGRLGDRVPAFGQWALLSLLFFTNLANSIGTWAFGRSRRRSLVIEEPAEKPEVTVSTPSQPTAQVSDSTPVEVAKETVAEAGKTKEQLEAEIAALKAQLEKTSSS